METVPIGGADGRCFGELMTPQLTSDTDGFEGSIVAPRARLRCGGLIGVLAFGCGGDDGEAGVEKSGLCKIVPNTY